MTPSHEENARAPKRWDIRGVMAWTVPFLKDKGLPAARLDCELMLAKVLGLRRIDLYMQIDRPLSAAEQQAFGVLLRRRVKREPMAYLLGEREFLGRVFRVTPAVLIPRPETELLVEDAAAFLQAKGAGLRILDVGTGSGCIAVSLALALPEATLEAWDISQAALDIAAENARQFGVADRITFKLQDALLATSWPKTAIYDVIVSNPPYIAPAERAMLDKDVIDYEPAEALFASAEGLAFYQAMADWARPSLKTGGRMFWEIGFAQKQAICELLAAKAWQDLQLRLDYSGITRLVSVTP